MCQFPEHTLEPSPRGYSANTSLYSCALRDLTVAALLITMSLFRSFFLHSGAKHMMCWI